MTDSARAKGRRIVDAHLHLYDSAANRYAVFESRQAGFEAIVGDYTALPRTYLLDAYRCDSASRQVEALIWHEFISEDPVAELVWAQRLAEAVDMPMALVGLVDFLDPGLPERLDLYRSLPHARAVRQHLGWDETNPLRRFAARPDLMSDPQWLAGLKRLDGGTLRCGLEVFAPQLPDLLEIVRRHPDIGFTVAVTGWPLDISAEGRVRWQADMAALARCGNTVVSISAVECIFGLRWTADHVKSWILPLVESFGPARAMLGSHLPITGLSHGFEVLYDAYEAIFAGFSDDEQDRLFRRTALEWFRVPAG